jgi:hypothetical protein
MHMPKIQKKIIFNFNKNNFFKSSYISKMSSSILVIYLRKENYLFFYIGKKIKKEKMLLEELEE